MSSDTISIPMKKKTTTDTGNKKELVKTYFTKKKITSLEKDWFENNML